jgi:hypothetical protein
MTEMTGTSWLYYPLPTTFCDRTFCDRRFLNFVVVVVVVNRVSQSQPELPTESPPEPPATSAIFSQPAISLATCTIFFESASELNKRKTTQLPE